MANYLLYGRSDDIIRIDNKNKFNKAKGFYSDYPEEAKIITYTPYPAEGIITIKPINVKIKFKYGDIGGKTGAWGFEIEKNPRDIELTHNNLNIDKARKPDYSESIEFSYNKKLTENDIHIEKQENIMDLKTHKE